MNTYPRDPHAPAPWAPVALPFLQYLATPHGIALKNSPYVFAYEGMVWGGRGRVIRIRSHQLTDTEFSQVLDIDGTLEQVTRQRNSKKKSAASRSGHELAIREEKEAVRRNHVLQARKAQMEIDAMQVGVYPPGHPWAGHPMPTAAPPLPGGLPPASPLDSVAVTTGPGPVIAGQPPQDPTALAAQFQVPMGTHPAVTPPGLAIPGYPPVPQMQPPPAPVSDTASVLQSIMLTQQRQTEAIERLCLALESGGTEIPAAGANGDDPTAIDACGECGKKVPEGKDPARWLPRHKTAAHGKLAEARTARNEGAAAT